MWRKELLKNKLLAIALAAVGVAMTMVAQDATALVVSLLIAGPMFFSKENWVL